MAGRGTLVLRDAPDLAFGATFRGCTSNCGNHLVTVELAFDTASEMGRAIDLLDSRFGQSPAPRALD